MLHPKHLPLLHDFEVVCQQGNLTRAAEVLGTVQSGVTQRISRLEDALGRKLLQRHSRGVIPTEQGEILFRYAQQITQLIDNAQSEIDAWEGSPSGSISLGLPPSVAAVLTTPLIQAIKASLPNVELTIAEAFSGYLHNWLENEEIDFAFGFDLKLTDTLIITPMLEEELYLIVPSADATRLPLQLTIKDLAGLPLITPSRRHRLRTDLEAIAFQHGIQLDVCLEVDAGHQLIRQIIQGTGYSLLAKSSVGPELKEGKLAAIQFTTKGFNRRVCLSERRSSQTSFLHQRVKQVITQVVANLVATDEWPGKPLQ